LSQYPVRQPKAPYKHLRVKRPQKNDTKAIQQKTDLAEKKAAFLSWWNQRKQEDSPVSAEGMEYGLQIRKIRPGVGGVWVSKRMLYDDCMSSIPNSNSSVLTWGRFIQWFKEVRPTERTKLFEFRHTTASGLLINKWSEVFVWFPGSRVQPSIVRSDQPLV